MQYFVELNQGKKCCTTTFCLTLNTFLPQDRFMPRLYDITDSCFFQKNGSRKTYIVIVHLQNHSDCIHKYSEDDKKDSCVSDWQHLCRFLKIRSSNNLLESDKPEIKETTAVESFVSYLDVVLEKDINCNIITK